MTNSRKELSFSGHTHTEYAVTDHTHSNYMTESQVKSLISSEIEASSKYEWTLSKTDFTLISHLDGGWNASWYRYAINIITTCGFIPTAVYVKIANLNINATYSYSGTYTETLTESELSQSYTDTNVPITSGTLNGSIGNVGSAIMLKYSRSGRFALTGFYNNNSGTLMLGIAFIENFSSSLRTDILITALNTVNISLYALKN